MPRPKTYPKLSNCQRCGNGYFQLDGRHRYCSLDCSTAQVTDNIEQLRAGEGPAFEKWALAMQVGAQRIAAGIEARRQQPAS